MDFSQGTAVRSHLSPVLAPRLKTRNTLLCPQKYLITVKTMQSWLMTCPPGAQHSGIMPRGRKPMSQAPQADKANGVQSHQQIQLQTNWDKQKWGLLFNELLSPAKLRSVMYTTGFTSHTLESEAPPTIISAHQFMSTWDFLSLCPLSGTPEARDLPKLCPVPDFC